MLNCNKAISSRDNYKIPGKHLLASQQILHEMEDAGVEIQPDSVTAGKQLSASKIIEKCLIP